MRLSHLAILFIKSGNDRKRTTLEPQKGWLCREILHLDLQFTVCDMANKTEVAC
jgi:hypothetical protein